MENKSKCLRLLELYSGIGGMRYALEFAGIPYELVAAVDVNPVVNCVYCYNFGNINHLQRNIQSFTASELDKMNLDIITMSPPCQPFTRVGLKKDVEDARSCSFLHILNVISQLHCKPTFLLLENVKGFEESVAHSALIETLKSCCYTFQEFLLSPSNFGIPNSRLRYYIIAKLEPATFSFPVKDQILSEIPLITNQWHSVCEKCFKEGRVTCQIKHFLEDKPDDYFDAFLVPDTVLLKYAKVFDIIYEDSSQSCCFTKAYGRYSLGTGSIFTPCSTSEVSEVFKKISFVDKNEELQLLKTLKLRYFTPREVANLMCFPKKFSNPLSVNDKQMYRALGNSINIFVVSCLMKLLAQT